MIIIQLAGGLGNQMQQYALYRKLLSLGKDAKVDISWFREEDRQKNVYAKRDLELDYFKNVEYEACTEEERKALAGGGGLAGKIRGKLFPGTRKIFRESEMYHPEIFDFEDRYLCGYFACEKYYADIMEALRKQFVFPESGHAENRKMAERMRNGESVSIHIRRGDYLDAADVYGGICTDAYYNRAIRYMIEKYEKPSFFVFTNDTFWAEKWCEVRERETGRRFTVVQGTDEETGYIDLMLMSLCKAHIIANSSFSWWGAWLDASPDKCVVAPVKWINTQECRDIYTEDMVRIGSNGKIRTDV